jgi:adenylate cyclase
MPDTPHEVEPNLDPFASPTRTRELVEQLPVVVYVDRDDYEGGTLYISPNVEKILGISAEQVIEDRDLWWRAVHPEDRDDAILAWEEAWRNGKPYRAEYRMLRPDGEEVWVRDSCVLVLSGSGERLEWQGILEDLTGAKRSQEDVRSSEARYRALVERIPAVVYEMGPDDERQTLYVSRHVEEVLGYTREEWLDQPDIWIELLHADDREIALARHDLHSETGEPWDIEYRLIANDGRVVWVHDRATLIRERGGSPVAWHGVMIDVTAEHEAREMLLLHKEDLERRVAERTNELQEANELMSLEIGERRRMELEVRTVQDRYRNLVENMPGIGYVWEVKAEKHRRSLSYVSPRVREILGYEPEGWEPCDRVHPHDQASVIEAIDRSVLTGEPFRMEYRFLASDGSVVWVLDHATLIARTDDGEPASFQGMMLDISGRKDAERKAAAAEDRFRTITEGGPVVAYSYDLVLDRPDPDPPIDITYLSPQVADLVRYPIAHWLKDPVAIWLQMVHPDDRELVGENAQHAWRTGDPYTIRYRMIRSDGEVIWLLDTGCMVERDPEGRPWRFQGILFDITEHEVARMRLEAAERGQREALDGASAVPWTEAIEPDTGVDRFTYIGPQALDVFGYTPEELMSESTHFSRLVHPDDRARVDLALARSEESGIWDESYRVIRRDGEVRWIQSFGRRVSGDDEVPERWHGVAIDVTAARAGSAPLGTRDAVDELDA